MKAILFIWLITGSCLHAQNAFVDGINETKEVNWTDGNTRFNAFGFKLDMLNTCTAKYTATEMYFEGGSENSWVIETNWKWIDIASIEIDTVKNIVRFNSKNPMPCAKEDIDTKMVNKDPDNNILNIYFKTATMCHAAANWALEHIKTCGGKAFLIN